MKDKIALAAVAKLRAQGCTKKEIAEILGIKPGTTANLLSRATKCGFLKEAPEFCSLDLTDEEMRDVDGLVQPRGLKIALGNLSKAVREVWAFSSMGPGIGRPGADILGEILQS